jgi:hypothetical protein
MSRRKRIRRPSPALVVAVIALIAAIQGSAIANGVEGLAAKARSISGTVIKKNSLPANRIKNDSITGAQVNEAKLGKVPSATNADTAATAATAQKALTALAATNADTATTAQKALTAVAATNASHADSADSAASATALAGATRVFKRVTSSASNATYATARDAATKVPLGSGGTFSVYGKCFKSGSNLYAVMYIETSANGAIVGGYSPGYWYGDLQTNSPENSREVITTNTSNNAASIYDYGDFNAIGIDGKVLAGAVGVYVKQGTMPTGDGAFGSGDVCIFRYEGRPVTTVG